MLNSKLCQIAGFILIILIACASHGAIAGEIAKPWQMNFVEPASPVMEKIISFHNELLIIITAVSIFVLLLILYVCFRFSAKRNPVPSTTTHNTTLEIIWTAIPIIILIYIAFPSFKLLYFGDKSHNPEMTLKAVGYQWYWGYVYPDNGNIEFESRIIPEKELKPGQIRLLEVDNRVVLPVDTDIRILTTAADVIHAWAVPALGVKIDAVPGRLNETWVRINKPGVYRGQCSELCGVDHGFMPIVVEAVSKEEFKKWSEKQAAKN